MTDRRTLFTWIGLRDLDAARDGGNGPIAHAVSRERFHAVHLLSDHAPDVTEAYATWLAARTSATLVRHLVTLPRGPSHLEDVYHAAVSVLTQASDQNGRPTFYLSPGTPVMASVWLLLASTRFPARLVESSDGRSLNEVHVPFEISAVHVGALLDAEARTLGWMRAALPAGISAPTGFQYAGPQMERLVAAAQHVALTHVPLLIEGETGTGKELLARAVHEWSRRRAGPFVAVNCGAIPRDLVESQLFGHTRGAFTGATRDEPGAFRAASGGTLLLDELGELPLDAQVKLLRATQDLEIVPVGSQRAVRVDVRLVAATHRPLLRDVAEGRFRADLYYRLAVARIRLPALREREDLGLLIDGELDRVNAEFAAVVAEVGGVFTPKNLTLGAKNLMLSQAWPGNHRELHATLVRAALWAPTGAIDELAVRDALDPSDAHIGILGRPLGDGFDLQTVLGDVARHYLDRALTQAGGVKARAARLLGLSSAQTLSNWLSRYDKGDLG